MPEEKISPYSIIALMLVAILAVGAWWYYAPATSGIPDTQGLQWSEYTSPTGFSVRYPSDYILNEAHVYEGLGPDRVPEGISLTIPPALTEGTNLSPDSYLSVETIPAFSSCHAAQYMYEQPVSGGEFVTDAGVTYSIATSSGAAAGNLYQETVYVRQDEGPCLAVRYFLHSTTIGNYEDGTVREFDKDALVAEFDQIRRTLTRSVRE